MYLESGFGTFNRAENELDYEAFCCGQTLMEDGRVVIAGSNFGSLGQGFENVPGPQVAIYNPATNTWTKMVEEYELNESRYYPSVYRLTDGRIGAFGGQAIHTPTTFVGPPYEINPNKTTLMTAWDQPIEDDWDFVNYPHLFHISSNEMFFAGPGRQNPGGPNGGRDSFYTFHFDLSNPEGLPTPYGGLSETWHNPSVMYRPGMILKSGGVEELDQDYTHDDMLATPNAERLTVSVLTRNTWQYVTPMNKRRIDHNLVVLPNGKVLAVGGTRLHGLPHRAEVGNWIQDGEIWDPDTNTWTLTAAFGGTPLPNVFRGYHSIALLMPDARVLVAGGDTATETQPPSGHFYLPDYGSGTRPQIVAAPDLIEIGSNNVSVEMNSQGEYRAVLIGLGAVTHSLDSNQRWVELSPMSEQTTDEPTFLGPTSTSQTPVGHYMLFILKDNGSGKWLPCQMAKYVKVVPSQS